MDDDGPDGHFVLLGGFARLAQRLAHEVLVVVGIDDQGFVGHGVL
jgi:hypothetical protein